MQVQRQQVYEQEKSGLDQPSPNNHRTQNVLFFLSATCWQGFPLSGSWGGPFWKNASNLFCIILQLFSKSTELFSFLTEDFPLV